MGAESAFASAFDEAGFRTAIKDTMLMGMPPNVEDRLTWCWDRDKTFDPQDMARKPYSWDQTPVTDQPGNSGEVDGELQVPYALEFSSGGTVGNQTGLFDTSSATVTLMDGDFEQVKTADFCKLGTSRYEIQFAAPTIGLFDVGVVQVFLKARDES